MARDGDSSNPEQQQQSSSTMSYTKALSLAGLRPYAQVKYIRPIENDTEDSDVALTIGLRF